MKIAVTGATGFIGRHVLSELARHDLEVIAVTGRSGQSDAPLPCARTVSIDLNNLGPDPFDLMGRPDTLIHLAWGGLPNYRSLHHFEQELPEHYRFLSSLVNAGLANCLVTGTCFEYGMRSGSLAENQDALPANPYGFAKNTLRCQLEFLQTATPFNLSWARLFYLYGTGQAPSSLYMQLRSAIDRGEQSFKLSGGEQLRDFLPVEEAARLLVALVLKECNSGIVNICSGTPISVRNLVESWVRDHQSHIELQFGHFPYPDYEPMAFWGDRRKLNSLLTPHDANA